MQRFGPVIIIVAVVLVVAIGGAIYFLLAPANSSVEVRPLTAQSNVVSLAELNLSVPPAIVPADFKVGLGSVVADQFLQNTDPALATARANLPAYLTPASSIFTLTTEGTLPTEVTLAIKINGAPESLDLYTWDGENWSFLPSRRNGDRMIATTDVFPRAVAAFQAANTVQVTSTTLEVGESLGDIGSALNVVEVSGPTLQADGSLVGGIAGGFTAGQGYAVLPVVRSPEDGGVALNAMLADPNARLQQIGSLVDLVNSGDYNGVTIEYRQLDPVRGPAFTKLMADLSAALHQQNKILAVVAPTPAIENGEYNTGGYDLRSLGEAADVIELPLSDDLAAVGNGSAGQMIGWATGQVNRYRLRLLTSTLSTDSANGAIRRISTTDALAWFGNATLETDAAQIAPGALVSVKLNGKVQTLDYDAQAFAPRFTYTDDGGVTHTITYVTPETLAHQLALAQTYRLGGVSVRGLFAPGSPSTMLDTLVQFKVNNAALTSSGAALNYVVSNSNGVIAQATGLPDQPFTWTAGDPGSYSIAANLQSAGGVGFGSVDVVVPLATPLPTSTPTSRPYPTATPCGGPCPTAVPVPTTAPSSPIGGGGAWGPFELGGQTVHGGIPHAADMKRAGMTWVKIQGHYGDDLAPAINSAHNQGFKILLSVVGDKSNVMNPGYQSQFASYMATLASQGANALEVWNEPNIDREWPTGQVSGANYAALLKVVYPAVKAANNSTIVISAAPAPTGYFGGQSCGHANGCDDRPFLTEFVAAGGGSYLDCIGAHYNEGIVSPTEIGTDPRDNYFTRYYATMLTTYSGIFNAARPVCFTELGYLTGEGYPDLASTAPSFGWAGKTTIAQQAQWLAQAALLSKANSNVRLMIIFNVDFTVYGSDPQAGYAIIRADGGCPACDSLDAVMP